MKFPVYGRLEEEDLKIVPHNIDVLEDWQGHANVEWCGSAYTPVYLYKYIYKGNNKTSFFNHLNEIKYQFCNLKNTPEITVYCILNKL